VAERDLDSYLEGLGIDVDEERERDSVLDDVEGVDEVDEERFDDDGYDDEATDEGADEGADDGEILDMETAMGAYGIGGVIPDDLDPRERAETFLVHLLLDLDAAYAVDVSDRGDEILAEISGGDAGRLIGKGGRTLAALEFLANAVVNKGDAEPIRVVIDVGGYKRRRDERLRQTAQRAIARVRKAGHAVELEPMSAAERRIVHMVVADEPDVVSESTGEGRARRVVIQSAD
jgi:spoIIIJ-associated protein